VLAQASVDRSLFAMSNPSSALLIKKHWAQKILEGVKKWEIRSSATSKRGVVALAVSGTGKLFGSVSISDCILVGERTSDGRLVQGKPRRSISLAMPQMLPSIALMT